MNAFADLIAQNCRQAHYLADAIQGASELELLFPVSLNIVCFRYRGNSELSDTELDSLNMDIVGDLQLQGIAAPSTTRIGGRLAIRVALTNHRTRQEDLDTLVAGVLRLGNERSAL